MEYGQVRMADGSHRQVARLILGTAGFGGVMDKDLSFRLMDQYANAGGNALDTARVYGGWHPGGVGASERIVGEWIRSRGMEKEIFLITKGAHPAPEAMDIPRLSPADILGDFECSLEDLGTEKIDLYFLHRDDISLPVSGIMDALDSLVQGGRALAIGASNWRAKRIEAANQYALEAGKAPFTATQIQWSYADYSPACPDPTLVLMDDAERAAYEKMPEISVMAFTSQAEGIFAKGYLPDLSDAAPRHRKYVTEENIRRYRELLRLCEKRGISPVQVALDYITRHPSLPGFALIGASSPAQLAQALE